MSEVRRVSYFLDTLTQLDPSQTHSMVPKDAAAALETTFQRILAEATFADAWPLSNLPAAEAMASIDLKILVPLLAPWKGAILIGSSEANAKDLTAGYHSLPDTMVDPTLATEFLAELAQMLARELFCAVDITVRTGRPVELTGDRAEALWATATGAQSFLGCNGTGRMIAALVTESE